MNEMTANYFREHLRAAVDEVVDNHEVLRVTRRKGGNFIVVSAEDWDAIAETLYLNQFPGFVDSIQAAAEEPLAQGTNLENLDW